MDYSNKFIQIAFNPTCLLGIMCTGNTSDALMNAYNSYWAYHTFTFYFTTRYLDANNNIKFTLNKLSGFDYPDNINDSTSVVATLYHDFYYIDDSILPYRNNRAYQLESYTDTNLGISVPAQYINY
jgi:hypothetical protein